MEKLLLALAAVSLEGVVGVTNPVEAGDVVLGVLDPQQRQLFLLLGAATSKLAAAKKKGGEAIAVATSEGDILRAKAALRDELTPLELEERPCNRSSGGRSCINTKESAVIAGSPCERIGRSFHSSPTWSKVCG